MAFKGTASKSASGASMSKYDVEVEGRLTALETAVKELQSEAAGNAGGVAQVSNDSTADHEAILKLVKVVKDELDVDIV